MRQKLDQNWAYIDSNMTKQNLTLTRVSKCHDIP